MKKLLAVAVVALGVYACNKAPEAKEFKTAYVDTNKMMEDFDLFKELDEKYKTKGGVMGRELEVEAKKLKAEMGAFQQNAMAKGEAWAQQKGAELQRRQQELQYAEQTMMQQLQAEGGKERDSIVKQVREYIKTYGKEKGYDYIYGTGDAATVLYAKDSYDITKEMTKAVNAKFPAKNPVKEEEKKEEKK